MNCMFFFIEMTLAHIQQALMQGVSATFTKSGNNDAKLQRIRFSRQLFSPEDAMQWYEQHKDVVLSICAASSAENTPIARHREYQDNCCTTTQEESPDEQGLLARLRSRNLSFDVRELMQFYDNLYNPGSRQILHYDNKSPGGTPPGSMLLGTRANHVHTNQDDRESSPSLVSAESGMCWKLVHHHNRGNQHRIKLEAN